LSFTEKFTEVYNQQRAERAERDRERIRLLTADPFDPEAQQLIAEEIRQETSLCVIQLAHCLKCYTRKTWILFTLNAKISVNY